MSIILIDIMEEMNIEEVVSRYGEIEDIEDLEGGKVEIGSDYLVILNEDEEIDLYFKIR